MSRTMIDTRIARYAANNGPWWSRSKLNKVSARELEAHTSYKEAGLTAAEVRARIYMEWERQEHIREVRRESRPPLSDRPGRILRLVETKARNLQQTAREFERCRPILQAQRSKRGVRQVRVENLIFRAVEEGRWNDNRYSRSWHMQYGATWEVTERRVDMLSVDRLGDLEVIGSAQLTSFRGNWMIRAIVELLGLEKVSVPRALRPIQMGHYYSVERVRGIGGVEIYRRRFAGEPVDFCAVADGETYHADTPKLALDGLRKKLIERERAASAQAAREAEILTEESGRRFGFCLAGMRDFCESNGLDIEGAYTRAELRRAVARRKRDNLDRWGTELHRAGLA